MCAYSLLRKVVQRPQCCRVRKGSFREAIESVAERKSVHSALTNAILHRGRWRLAQVTVIRPLWVLPLVTIGCANSGHFEEASIADQLVLKGSVIERHVIAASDAHGRIFKLPVYSLEIQGRPLGSAYRAADTVQSPVLFVQYQEFWADDDRNTSSDWDDAKTCADGITSEATLVVFLERMKEPLIAPNGKTVLYLLNACAAIDETNDSGFVSL